MRRFFKTIWGIIVIGFVFSLPLRAGLAQDDMEMEETIVDTPVIEEILPDSLAPDTLKIELPPSSSPTIPEPPVQLKVKDAENDRGGILELTWERSADDGKGNNHVVGYIILRSTSPGGDFAPIDTVAAGVTHYRDQNLKNKTPYYYKVQALSNENVTSEMNIRSEKGIAAGQWFNTTLWNILIGVAIFGALIFWYLSQAQKKELFVRRIPGLSAVGEAIGRSTEMGRPVLYVPGIGSIANIQTLASLAIMGEVAKITAEYDTKLIVPCRDPIVMTAADETVREGYLDAGRLDAYSPENVRFLTDEQFAYVAGVNGIMLREHPAANLYLGEFYAESLILAETGFSAGAIQVAGTASVAQIPFFVAACDYTLIGEELFAASAYLSRDPRLIANLKSSDIGKAIFVILMLAGVILSTIGYEGFRELFTISNNH